MALFAALIEFTQNEELRLQTRPVHREYLRGLLDAGKLAISGPWADDTGALIIYDAEDMAEAERILDGLRRRDELDSTRAVAPLRAAPDARIISTDGNRFEDTVDAVVNAIRDAEARRAAETEPSGASA